MSTIHIDGKKITFDMPGVTIDSSGFITFKTPEFISTYKPRELKQAFNMWKYYLKQGPDPYMGLVPKPKPKRAPKVEITDSDRKWLVDNFTQLVETLSTTYFYRFRAPVPSSWEGTYSRSEQIEDSNFCYNTQIEHLDKLRFILEQMTSSESLVEICDQHISTIREKIIPVPTIQFHTKMGQ